MKLALIRQRYNPYGGAERFAARALAALGEQGVAPTLYAREWNTGEAAAAGAQIEWVRCDPYYLGSLWRDAGFARAVCRELARRS